MIYKQMQQITQWKYVYPANPTNPISQRQAIKSPKLVKQTVFIVGKGEPNQLIRSKLVLVDKERFASLP
jgi:hypothetical protein